jgi:hypothetical protein
VPVHPAFSSNDSSIFISPDRPTCLHMRPTRQRLRVSSRTPLSSLQAEAHNSLRDAARRCHLPNNQIVKEPTRRSWPKPVSILPADQEPCLQLAFDFTEETARNQHSNHLGSNKVGKGESTPFQTHRQHHRQKNPLAVESTWTWLPARKPPASNAESSEFLRRFLNIRILKTRARGRLEIRLWKREMKQRTK